MNYPENMPPLLNWNIYNNQIRGVNIKNESNPLIRWQHEQYLCYDDGIINRDIQNWLFSYNKASLPQQGFLLDWYRFFYVESGDTEEVKRFFDTFPHLLDNFQSPNNWNPFLYAARYGNIELIDYFKEKAMKSSTSGILSSYSIVHTAVYSGDPSILEYILKNL